MDNFKCFTAILALCFNSPTPSLQSVSMSVFWLRPHHPLQSISSVSILSQNPHTPKPADAILQRSLAITYRSKEKVMTTIVIFVNFEEESLKNLISSEFAYICVCFCVFFVCFCVYLCVSVSISGSQGNPYNPHVLLRKSVPPHDRVRKNKF